MDFKSRFAGKMTKLDKDGGIDAMINSSNKPIKEVDQITIKSLYASDNEMR
jgi:hypothetical protein